MVLKRLKITCCWVKEEKQEDSEEEEEFADCYEIFWISNLKMQCKHKKCMSKS